MSGEDVQEERMCGICNTRHARDPRHAIRAKEGGARHELECFIPPPTIEERVTELESALSELTVVLGLKIGEPRD